jgi:hypothetical protein
MRKSVKQAPDGNAKNAGQFNSLTILCTGHPAPQTKADETAPKEAETEEKTKKETLTENDKTRTACQ